MIMQVAERAVVPANEISMLISFAGTTARSATCMIMLPRRAGKTARTRAAAPTRVLCANGRESALGVAKLQRYQATSRPRLLQSARRHGDWRAFLLSFAALGNGMGARQARLSAPIGRNRVHDNETATYRSRPRAESFCKNYNFT